MLDEIKISSKFETLLEEPEGVRYYIITGGRGSSKSFSVGLWASLKTFQKHVKILYTRFTLVSAKKSIIPEFEEKIDILKARDHFNINNYDIQNLETGSEILFSGIKTSSGNQTANLKSLQGVSVWVLEEAEEETDEDRFDKIDLSVRSNKSNNIVILILNPSTKEHWIYKRFFEDAGVQEGFNGVVGDTCYIHTTYLDNEENLSDTFIKRIERMKTNNPKKYHHIIEGGWMEKAEGVIFQDWEYGKFDDSLPFRYSLDFGYSDHPDACGRIAIDDKNNILYLEEVFYEYGQEIDVISKRIAKLDKAEIVADSAEDRLINHLRTKAKRQITAAKKPPNSVLQGIKLMQNYKIVVCGHSPNLVKELNNYVWADKGKLAPVKEYDHLIDGFRYVVFMYSARHFEVTEIKDSMQRKFNRGEFTGMDGQAW